MNLFLSQNIEEIFDPVQTHCVRGVSVESINETKRFLKEQYQATRFRIVKSHIKGIKTICFKMKGNL
jgi:hypothetical protein